MYGHYTGRRGGECRLRSQLCSTCANVYVNRFHTNVCDVRCTSPLHRADEGYHLITVKDYTLLFNKIKSSLNILDNVDSMLSFSGTLGRLVMFIVFLAFLFLYTSYSAYIVALLQSTSNRIRTLSDLLNSKLELGVEDVSYNRYYFSVRFLLVTLFYSVFIFSFFNH